MQSFAMLLPLVAAALVPSLSNAAATPTFKACDTAYNAHLYTRQGVGYTWWKSDDKVDFVAPGKGSCGETYTDASAVVCVAPGWTGSAKVNACNNWVEVVNDKTGQAAQARVLDTCGAVANTTFGCNDIYLSKEIFVELAGSNAKADLDAGHLEGSVSWRFIKEPCEACAAGLPGRDLNGEEDDCKGNQPYGVLRCGRLRGSDRITDRQKQKQYCQKSKNTCAAAKYSMM